MQRCCSSAAADHLPRWVSAPARAANLHPSTCQVSLGVMRSGRIFRVRVDHVRQNTFVSTAAARAQRTPAAAVLHVVTADATAGC